MSHKTFTFRSVALFLSVAVLMASAVLTPGAAESKQSGELTVFGSTKVDGEAAISGQTLFSGSVVETLPRSASIISLGSRGRLKLKASSRLKLSFDDSGLTGALDFGSARLSVPAGASAGVTAKGGTVASDSSMPASFSVEVEDNSLFVAVLEGRALVRTADGRTLGLRAGQFASVEGAKGPQSGGGVGAGNALSGRKLAAILLPVGGAIAIIAIVFAGRDDDNDEPPDGCVEILSPVDGGGCP